MWGRRQQNRGSRLLPSGGLNAKVNTTVTSSALPATVLVVLVCTKLLFDHADVHRDRLAAFDERSSVDIGWADDTGEWVTVETEIQKPVEIGRSQRLSLLVDGFVHGCRTRASDPVIVLVGVSILFGFLGRSRELVLYGSGVALALLTFLAGCGVVDRLVRYLSMEYRAASEAGGLRSTRRDATVASFRVETRPLRSPSDGCRPTLRHVGDHCLPRVTDSADPPRFGRGCCYAHRRARQVSVSHRWRRTVYLRTNPVHIGNRLFFSMWRRTRYSRGSHSSALAYRVALLSNRSTT